MEQIVTKNSKAVKVGTVIGAIDIGSSANYGYYRSRSGYEIEPFEFSNNREGLDRYWEAIRGFKESQQLDEILIGIESTGIYTAPVMNYFKDKPVRLVQINPKHTKRAKEITDNSPNKTDKKDPRVIADIMELGKYQGIVRHEGAIAELKSLTLARERVTGRRTEISNQLHALVFNVFPELTRILKLNGTCAEYILKTTPTPEEIVEYGESRLVRKLTHISRGKLKEEKIRALYKAAGSSVGTTAGRDGMLTEIREILFERTIMTEHIKKLETKMCYFLDQVPVCKYLLTMKGLGTVSVAGIIGELGDFSGFSHSDEILKYAGLNLYEISSGDHRGQKRISKIGRSLVRKHLFYAAINTIRKNGIMHEKFAGYIARGMNKMKALVAIMKKLLVIMFALVKKRCEFKHNYPVPVVTAA